MLDGGGMARALRIDIAGAWYHGMNRGHRGGALFLDDTDRRRFLGAVAELPERFGLEVHAFVLMDNHYHLLVRTREAHLSHAMRWLNVSYAVKFNWAHRCRGTVFQGRFKSVLIQQESKAVEVLSRARKRTDYTWSGTWTYAGEVRYLYDGRRVLQERKLEHPNSDLHPGTRTDAELSDGDRDASGPTKAMGQARTDGSRAAAMGLAKPPVQYVDGA